MERDDALTELEILKEKLDKALYSNQKTVEEKETAHKEYEKMLEKYDRYKEYLKLLTNHFFTFSLFFKCLMKYGFSLFLQITERNLQIAEQDRYIRGRQRSY